MLAIISLFGLISGSFANVCIHRIPKVQSVIFPNSHCPKCGINLKVRDLIPVISYVFLKGHCRYCKKSIPVRYVFVEIFVALGFIFIWYFSQNIISFLWLSLHFFILTVLASIDIEHMILPDKLTLSGTVLGIITSSAGPGITESILGGILGFGIIGVIAFITRGDMGMGDAKLLMYIGTLVGVGNVLTVLFLASILGLIFTIPFLIIKKRSFKRAIIAFGPYLAIAGLIILLGDNIIIYFPYILVWG